MRWAVRLAATFFALTWLVFPGFGLADLAVTWDEDWPVMLEAGWGLLFAVLVGAAFVRVAVRPHRAAPAIVQLLVVAAVLAASAVAGFEWPLLLVGLALAAEALVVAFVPGREPLAARVGSVSWPLAVVAAAGLVPWMGYGVQMYAANRVGLPDDVTIGIDHYAVQGRWPWRWSY